MEAGVESNRMSTFTQHDYGAYRKKLKTKALAKPNDGTLILSLAALDSDVYRNCAYI